MSRKKKYKPKSFESSGISSDTSSNIFHSMLVSAAFQSLTAPQQILYVCMKDRKYHQKRHPENNEEMFYFNRAIQREYGFKNPTQFCKDRDALIEKGFIKVVVSGAYTRTKDIYKYSDIWQKYGTSEFSIEYNEMSTSLAKKKRKKQESTKRRQIATNNDISDGLSNEEIEKQLSKLRKERI